MSKKCVPKQGDGNDGERLDEGVAWDRGLAEGVLQHPAGPPGPAASSLESSDEGADRAGGPGSHFPKGDHPSGDVPEPAGADPRGAPGGVPPARPAHAPLPRDPAREVPWNPREDLLQAGGP